ncbi:MAG: hypothetical protein Q4D96_00700 [Propionibacteriaceae bacterium]|nr:hypothetical protein [Propionibacteriaceae bacterium]
MIRDGKSGFDDPESIEGIEYLRDLIADGAVTPPQVVAGSKADRCS